MESSSPCASPSTYLFMRFSVEARKGFEHQRNKAQGSGGENRTEMSEEQFRSLVCGRKVIVPWPFMKEVRTMKKATNEPFHQLYSSPSLSVRSRQHVSG